MPNLSAILDAASVQVIDTATSTYRVNSAIGDITLAATAADYTSYRTVVNGAGSVLALPGATVWFVYVKNLDAAATLRVRLTVTGGAQIAAADSPLLPPGGVFVYAAPVETSGGITGVTLISSAATSAAEVLLAG